MKNRPYLDLEVIIIRLFSGAILRPAHSWRYVTFADTALNRLHLIVGTNACENVSISRIVPGYGLIARIRYWDGLKRETSAWKYPDFLQKSSDRLEIAFLA